MFDKKMNFDNQKLPRHIAFIMDGNGRWAKSRLLPRNAGHKAGVSAVKKLIENALELGIKHITFYAFSTENWKRPKEEIDGLFNIFRDFLKENKNNYKEKDIKVNVLGDYYKFPEDMVKSIEEIIANTINCKKMSVNMAFNYGSRAEIIRAVRLMKEDNADITEENFSKYLYTHDIPDPDLIIRTSGEKRLSNFLLFQAAYSELYFTNVYWPDFDYNELVKAIQNYTERSRRFGSAV